MKTNPQEFVRFLRRIPKTKYYLIPLQKNGKIPAVRGSIKDRIEEVALTPKEAVKLMKQGYNIACYALPQGLVFIDLDLDECSLPEEKLNELHSKLNTLAQRTRNGGIQFIGINGGFENSVLFYNGEKLGEIRANWQYILVPGSYVPPDSELGDGHYSIVVDKPVRELTPQDLPSWIEVRKKAEKKKVRIAPRPKPAGGWSVNGRTLEELMEKDSKLKNLLSGPFECGYPSRSEADFALAIKLLSYGFSEDDVASILQHYRPYEKTMREDYLELTVGKADDQWYTSSKISTIHLKFGILITLFTHELDSWFKNLELTQF